MKNLKFILPLFALILGLTLVFTSSAFKSQTKQVTTLKYRYDGTNASGTTTLANWVDVSDQPNPVSCGGEEIPCLVEFTSTQYADMSAFIAAHNTPASIQNSGFVTAQKDAE